MRASRALVLAGGTVAFATGVVRQCRRARCKPPLRSRRARLHLVPPIAATVIVAGIVPDALSPDWGWFSGFADFILAGFGWVADAIRRAVGFVGDFILSVMSTLEWVWDETWETMTGTVVAISQTVEGLARGAVELGIAVTTGLAEQGRNLLSQMGNLLENVATEAFELLKPYVGGLIEDLLGAGGFVFDAIRGTVQSMIDSAIDAALGGLDLAGEIIDQVWANLFDFIMSIAKDIVLKGLNEVFDGIVEVIDLLVGWWLAVFRFLRDWPESLEQLITDAVAIGVDALRQVVMETIAENIDDVTRMVGDVFGISA